MFVVLFFHVFFFFKQKTAYEVRISDWSSDVGSSDLRAKVGAGAAKRLLLRAAAISGDSAVERGVADELAEPGAALGNARRLARSWATFPGSAWQRTKAMIGAEDEALERALALEAKHQA